MNGLVPYDEFALSFQGKQFYNQKTGRQYDKWEVYEYYKKGAITWMQLQSNRDWIQNTDKPGWKDGKRIYAITKIY